MKQRRPPEREALWAGVCVRSYTYRSLVLGFGPAQRATAVLQWSAAAQRYTVATPAHQPAANAHHLLHHHLDHYLNWYILIYLFITKCLLNIFHLKCVIKDFQIIDRNTNRVTLVIFKALYFEYEYTHTLVSISTHASHVLLGRIHARLAQAQGPDVAGRGAARDVRAAAGAGPPARAAAAGPAPRAHAHAHAHLHAAGALLAEGIIHSHCVH